MPSKVLISGPVNGKLDALFQRVATVNAKSGPFDALLCVGGFFEDDGTPQGGAPPHRHREWRAPRSPRAFQDPDSRRRSNQSTV